MAATCKKETAPLLALGARWNCHQGNRPAALKYFRRLIPTPALSISRSILPPPSLSIRLSVSLRSRAPPLSSQPWIVAITIPLYGTLSLFIPGARPWQPSERGHRLCGCNPSGRISRSCRAFTWASSSYYLRLPFTSKHRPRCFETSLLLFCVIFRSDLILYRYRYFSRW